MKSKWTLDEVYSALEAGRPSQETINMIMYVEKLFYNKHIDDIRARQDKLTKLWQDKNRFLAFWNGSDKWIHRGFRTPDISYGCWSCLFGHISHVRHSTKCTQRCDFCYYASPSDQYTTLEVGKGMYGLTNSRVSYTLDEMKLILDRQLLKYTAIGWLQKEPLEEVDAIGPVMKHIAGLGKHQYMYTNGVKATFNVIDKLADWGLNELRFNLMSTNFSDEVIERMRYAKTKIPSVLIETPIYSKSYKLFVDKRGRILDTNLDQINIPELQICSTSYLDHFIATEGPVYKHRRGYISPISSRHYAYDLIELAEKEDWPVIINDCSNDTKFFRGVHEDLVLGMISYKGPFELPLENVAYLASQILKPGEVYEFF